MIFALLLSNAVCAACVPNLGLTHKGGHRLVPNFTAEKRFTRAKLIEHKQLVDFSGLLVSIETLLIEFAGKQTHMTLTNSFHNLADSVIKNVSTLRRKGTSKRLAGTLLLC